MKKQKRSLVDYMWVISSLYLFLGMFNILFAWLGMLCFLIPLIMSVSSGEKTYCNKYCGRGQLFEVLGGKFKLSRHKPIPKFLKTKWFRYGFLAFFMTMFLNMIFNTYLVFAGTQNVSEVITLLWTFKLPWNVTDITSV
ncbi:MAG: 4Fe-4S binding protein, partial [Turicibacter sp.]